MLKSALDIQNSINFCGIGLYFAEGDKYINFPGKTKHGGLIGMVNSSIDAINSFLKKI